MRLIRRVVGLLALVTSSQQAWAQDAARPLPSPGYYLLQALLSLVVVVGLILLATFLLRRLQGSATPASRSGPAQVLQSLPLSGGQVLHVVALEDRQYLIVCGPQGSTCTPVDESPDVS